jgi:hypothetical protein
MDGSVVCGPDRQAESGCGKAAGVRGIAFQPDNGRLCRNTHQAAAYRAAERALTSPEQEIARDLLEEFYKVDPNKKTP